MNSPANPLSWIDPLWWLGQDTALESGTQAMQLSSQNYHANGGDTATTTQSESPVKQLYNDITSNLTSVETLLKVVVLGGLMFGGLVLIHEARKALK